MRGRRHARRVECAAAALFTLGAALLLSTDAATQDREENLGGDTTVVDAGVTAFGRALANLDARRWMDFRAGKVRFVSEPADRGRWADANTCADCHYRDGRGPRADDASGLTHLLRLGSSAGGGDPTYGIQLRRIGLGVPPPAQFGVEWLETRERYPDGDGYTLRRPAIRVSALAHGPLDPRTRLSLRVPPAVFGLGLLEAVAAEEIARRADASDGDGDGISGRLPMVRDAATGQFVVGRFGWKASQPSLAAQSAAALRADLAVDEGDVSALVLYMRALAVPARRRTSEPAVREGSALFSAIGCAACHRPQMTTGELPGWPELSHQPIRPYTDLLLHDLGPQLADDVDEGLASGSEWRTAPLWGIGLLATIGGAAGRLHTGLLHDGRARSAEEAILWHGGEADRARERFRHLPRHQRASVLAFLDSL